MGFFPIRVFQQGSPSLPQLRPRTPGQKLTPLGYRYSGKTTGFPHKISTHSSPVLTWHPGFWCDGLNLQPMFWGVSPLLTLRWPRWVPVSGIQVQFFASGMQAVETFFHATTRLLFPQKSSRATLLIEVPSMFRSLETIMLLLLWAQFKRDELVLSTPRTAHSTLTVCFPGLKHLENRRHFALVRRTFIQDAIAPVYPLSRGFCSSSNLPDEAMNCSLVNQPESR